MITWSPNMNRNRFWAHSPPPWGTIDYMVAHTRESLTPSKTGAAAKIKSISLNQRKPYFPKISNAKNRRRGETTFLMRRDHAQGKADMQ